MDEQRYCFVCGPPIPLDHAGINVENDPLLGMDTCADAGCDVVDPTHRHVRHYQKTGIGETTMQESASLLAHIAAEYYTTLVARGVPMPYATEITCAWVTANTGREE